jgi:hypothetical protein
MNVEFGDLRSLLHEDWLRKGDLFEMIAIFYQANPNVFLNTLLPYIEENLRVDKVAPWSKSINNLDLIKITDVLRESEVLATMVDSVTFCQNDTISTFSEILNISDLFRSVEFAFFDQSEEFMDYENFSTGEYFLNMRSLSFSYSNPYILKHLTKNSELERLSVSSGSFYNQEGVNESILYVLESSDLKTLKLSDISNFSLDSILPYCSSLENLVIEKIPISDVGATLISQSENLSNLEYLSLEACRIGDLGVEALANSFDGNLKGLKKIYLFGNPFHFYHSGGRALTNSRLDFDVSSYHDFNDMQR